MINIETERIYLDGARDMLLRLIECGIIADPAADKRVKADGKISDRRNRKLWDAAMVKKLLESREAVRMLLNGILDELTLKYRVSKDGYVTIEFLTPQELQREKEKQGAENGDD